MKGQALIEYISMYGWVLFLILIIGAVIWNLGIFNPFSYVDKQATGFSMTSIQDFKFNDKGALKLIFGTKENGLIEDIYVYAGNGSSYIPFLYPDNTVGAILFNVTPPTRAGKKFHINVTIIYTIDGMQHRDEGVLFGAVEPAVFPSDWWNQSYLCRQAITITNENSTGDLPSGYTINFTLDTYALISQGKMKSDCTDLRIVYNNAGIDRIIDSLRQGDFALSSTGASCFGGSHCSYAIDGSGDTSHYWSNVAAQNETLYLLGTIDLGSVKQLNEIGMHLWDGDSRYYYNYKVAISETGSFSGEEYVVFDGTGSGIDYQGYQNLTFPTHSARYIRIWISGNTVNAGGHVTEVYAYYNAYACNTEDTRILFRTQQNISSTDTYYIYYCNPSAPAPLQNKANVFLFYDDFDSLANWNTAGSPSVSGGILTLPSSSGVATTSNYPKSRFEARIAWNSTTSYAWWGWIASASTGSPPYILFDSYNSANQRPVTDTWSSSNTVISNGTYRIWRIDWFGDKIDYYVDGSLIDTHYENKTMNYPYVIRNSNSANTVYVDWVRGWKIFYPAPSASLSSETIPI